MNQRVDNSCAELSALLRRHLYPATGHPPRDCECVLVRRTSPRGRTALFLIEWTFFDRCFHVFRLRKDAWTPKYRSALTMHTYQTLPKPIVVSTYEKYEVFGVRNGSTMVRTFEAAGFAARNLVSALRAFYI